MNFFHCRWLPAFGLGLALCAAAVHAHAATPAAPAPPAQVAPQTPPALAPFTSDGCSLFPDRAPSGDADWCECCVAHDLAYWRGGTAAEREAADATLRACVLLKTKDEALAETMYLGVRAGGNPYFLTWYRWGYGWPYGRGYQALNAEERALADRLEHEYRVSNAAPICKKP